MSEGSPASADVPDESKSAQESASSSSDRLGRFRKRLIGVLKSGLSAIFAGLISGALVAFYLTPTGQASYVAIRHFSAKPSCTNPLWLLQVPDSQVFASAYYEQLDQIPNYRLFHVASNTIDGDLSTSWLQPWSPATRHPSLSSSDYIEWSFAQSYRIRRHLHCRRLGRGHQYIYGHIADRHRNGIFSRGDRASHVWFAKSFKENAAALPGEFSRLYAAKRQSDL